MLNWGGMGLQKESDEEANGRRQMQRSISKKLDGSMLRRIDIQRVLEELEAIQK